MLYLAILEIILTTFLSVNMYNLYIYIIITKLKILLNNIIKTI